jgi:hypothetical protein
MKEVAIEWCPTKKMVADFMTKPLQGSHFRNLRDYIMGNCVMQNPIMMQLRLCQGLAASSIRRAR